MAASSSRVFISYSHESTAHAERALSLAQRLRQDGVDAWIDQYENGTPKEGWPRWMLNRLDWAEIVLVICTKTYYRRFRGQDDPDTWRAILGCALVVVGGFYLVPNPLPFAISVFVHGGGGIHDLVPS